jgi:hypothetical protein
MGAGMASGLCCGERGARIGAVSGKVVMVHSWFALPTEAQSGRPIVNRYSWVGIPKGRLAETGGFLGRRSVYWTDGAEKDKGERMKDEMGKAIFSSSFILSPSSFLIIPLSR